MFKEREDRLLDVIYQRENSHQIKKDKKDREVRQRMFLVFVSHLSRMQAFSNLYYGEIKPERDRKAEEYLKNMKLKACQLIEKWYVIRYKVGECTHHFTGTISPFRPGEGYELAFLFKCMCVLLSEALSNSSNHL